MRAGATVLVGLFDLTQELETVNQPYLASVDRYRAVDRYRVLARYRVRHIIMCLYPTRR